MIAVNGRAVIEYALESAVKTGVDDIVMVVGYKAEDIINTYGNTYGGKRLRYVIQWEQKGLVHAIECSREALCGDDFALFLGDELLINPRHNEMIEQFNRTGVFALCGVLKVNDRNFIKKTYTLIQDDTERIYRLVEKPTNPLNDLMGTGNCVFRNEIFNYIEVTPVHHQRKEKELPDLIQCSIDDGKEVKSFMICDRYANINSFADMNQAESFFNELP